MQARSMRRLLVIALVGAIVVAFLVERAVRSGVQHCTPQPDALGTESRTDQRASKMPADTDVREPIGSGQGNPMQERTPDDPEKELVSRSTTGLSEKDGKRLVLERALKRYRAHAPGDTARYQLLIFASVATILDASGQYTIPEDGKETTIDTEDGYHHFAHNGRLYRVRPGEFPECDAFMMWAKESDTYFSDLDKGRPVSGSPPTFPSEAESLIEVRAAEAMGLLDH